MMFDFFVQPSETRARRFSTRTPASAGRVTWLDENVNQHQRRALQGRGLG